MRVRIVTNIDNGKGLERDYRLLRGLLESWGHEVSGVHFQRENCGGQADLVIFLEVYEPRLAEGAARRWLIPNAEWWRPEDAAALGDFELVLCKTRDALSHFAPLTPRARYLGFFSEDHRDPGVPRDRSFLHVPGGSDAKGTEAVLSAWDRYRMPYPLTVVSSLGWARRPRNVEFVGRIDERRLRWLQNGCRYHLCPSRYEGWGHVIHEGLSVGAAVVVPDTAAMNEIDGCALRIPARAHGSQGLVRTHLVHPDDIRNAVERAMAFTEADLRRIERAAREAFLSERERCFANLWEVLGDGRPAAAARRQEARICPTNSAPARLAIVFPCHASSAPLVRRSVLALRAQTAAPSSFEVVVAIDGGDPEGAIRGAVEPGSHPFRVEIVESGPPQGHLRHLGHAANVGYRAARAPLIWFLEADVLLPPEAVEHALAEHDAALLRGLPAVLAPVLARVASPPAAWMERSAALEGSGASEAFAALMRSTPLEGRGLHEERFCPGVPSSETLAEPVEGIPITWRGLVDALGGFDEDLADWGAAKGAFTDMLQGMRRAGLIDVRLLRSVRAVQQPHEAFPESRRPQEAFPEGRRRHVDLDERERRAQEIVLGARWWRERLSSIRTWLSAAVLDAAPTTTTAAPSAAAEGGIPDCSPEGVSERMKLVRAVRSVAAPALRGLFGGVVVVGEAAYLIAEDVVRECGLATRVATLAELAELPANHACGAILSRVLDGANPEERETALRQARRVVKATGPLVIAEIVTGSGGVARDDLVGRPRAEDAGPNETEIRAHVEHVGM